MIVFIKADYVGSIFMLFLPYLFHTLILIQFHKISCDSICGKHVSVDLSVYFSIVLCFF